MPGESDGRFAADAKALGTRTEIATTRLAAVTLVVGLCLGCARGAARPVVAEPPPPSATVTQGTFEVRFPRAACGACRVDGDSVANPWAGPFWEVLVHPDTGWLAGVLQVRPDGTRHLPVADSLPAMVAAARPATCALDSHVMACVASLRATARVTEMSVVVQIGDARWLHRLQAGRPDSVHLAFRRRNTETLWRASAAIVYEDR